MKRTLFALYRLVMAALAIVAVIVQLHAVLARQGSFANFMSFFTIQSNVFGAAIFILSAAIALRHRTWAPLGMLRGAATMYLVITGLVTALLLSGLQETVQTTIPWVNTVVHQIFPIVIALDWLIDPPQHRITFRRALWWLVYPAAYLVYSLVRGPIAHWYPYPFLNPANGGYGKVALTSGGILAGSLILIVILTARTAIGKPRVR
jgi:hypothetical protein